MRAGGAYVEGAVVQITRQEQAHLTYRNMFASQQVPA
jgi:hypothetical protein